MGIEQLKKLAIKRGVEIWENVESISSIILECYYVALEDKQYYTNKQYKSSFLTVVKFRDYKSKKPVVAYSIWGHSDITKLEECRNRKTPLNFAKIRFKLKEEYYHMYNWNDYHLGKCKQEDVNSQIELDENRKPRSYFFLTVYVSLDGFEKMPKDRQEIRLIEKAAHAYNELLKDNYLSISEIGI